MGFAHNLYCVSGLAVLDCSCLGQRYDDDLPFSPDACESMLITVTAEHSNATLTRNRFFTRLWRSLSGAVFITDTVDGLIHGTDVEKKDWTTHNLDCTLTGVWGLDDQTVFAWGQKGQEGVMFRWDGRTWTPMLSPGRVTKVHGLAPNNLLACGPGGLLAHWDGTAWTAIPIDTRESLMGLHMVSNDEYYVVGEQGGAFEGSAFGCRRRTTWSKSILADVTKWQGDIWIAGTSSGLLRFVGKTDELEVVKPNVEAASFDSRGDLLMASPAMVVGTTDGKAFKATLRGFIERIRKDKEPIWER